MTFRPISFCAAALLAPLLCAPVALAGSLQVAPVRLDVPAPSAVSSIKLHNAGGTPISAQVRIFRWTQGAGKDELVETRDVVASPPLLELEPQSSQVIRIVRLAKTPLVGEEAYRLIVDELPPALGRATKAINFVLRYSIPVFFTSGDDQNAKLIWAITSTKSSTTLHVENSGARSARLANVAMKTRGQETALSGGLVGYVLANSKATFTFPIALKGYRPGAPVEIFAKDLEGSVSKITEVTPVP